VTVGTGGFGGSGTTVGTGGLGGSGTGGFGGSVDGGTWEQQQLARLRRGIVGTWSGTSSNPWGAGCPTLMRFEASGHYSAHSPGDDSCIVLYYGSNADSPEKTYLLDNVLTSAEGEGDIEFWFAPSNTNRGQLRHVFLSDDENLLTFEAWKEQYGPIVFKLMRVSR
jgi:hypothetical protein